MSIYYECRFMDVVLDLKERDDIKLWFQKCKDVLNGILKDDDYIQYVPNELKEYSRVHTFYNDFEDDLDFNIDFLESDTVELNFCLGNKNRNEDFEHMIYMLKPYIKSGNIFWYNEICTYELDLEKITFDRELDSIDLTFIDVDETIKKYKDLLPTECDKEKYEYSLYSDVYDKCDCVEFLLHVGLK